MKIVVAEDFDVCSYAGRKIWMMGFTPTHTRILNPIEVFLYVEPQSASNPVFSLVRVSASGNIIPMFDLDDLPLNTYVFLAPTESQIFKIPEVIKIRSKFCRIARSALTNDNITLTDQENLFFGG